MAESIKYNVKLGDSVQKWGTAWTNSLKFLGETKSMTSLARGYRYYINKFVPKKTGELRKSARALGSFSGKGSAWVSWVPNSKVKDYLGYQYRGDVYGPNKAIFSQGPTANGAAGVHTGWVSPVKPKYNTGRKMGNKFKKVLHDGRVIYVKGYTTRNTGYEWLRRFREDTGDFGEKAVNVRAGRFIYELYCIKSQKTGHPQKPVGGYRVYYSWRQIEKIRT